MKKIIVLLLMASFLVPFQIIAGDPVSSFVDGFNKGYDDEQKREQRQSETEANQAITQSQELQTMLMLEKLKQEDPEAYNNYIRTMQARQEQQQKQRESVCSGLIVGGIVLLVVAALIIGLTSKSSGSTASSY
jgi:hypothetical protein